MKYNVNLAFKYTSEQDTDSSHSLPECTCTFSRQAPKINECLTDPASIPISITNLKTTTLPNLQQTDIPITTTDSTTESAQPKILKTDFTHSTTRPSTLSLHYLPVATTPSNFISQHKQEILLKVGPMEEITPGASLKPDEDTLDYEDDDEDEFSGSQN